MSPRHPPLTELCLGKLRARRAAGRQGLPPAARHGCVRERAETVRGADGRRIVKAARHVEPAVVVTAVTAVPRSGDGKHGCHTETL